MGRPIKHLISSCKAPSSGRKSRTSRSTLVLKLTLLYAGFGITTDYLKAYTTFYLENRNTTASRAAIFMLGGGWFAKETIHDGLFRLFISDFKFRN